MDQVHYIMVKSWVIRILDHQGEIAGFSKYRYLNPKSTGFSEIPVFEPQMYCFLEKTVFEPKNTGFSKYRYLNPKCTGFSKNRYLNASGGLGLCWAICVLVIKSDAISNYCAICRASAIPSQNGSIRSQTNDAPKEKGVVSGRRQPNGLPSQWKILPPREQWWIPKDKAVLRYPRQ